MGMRRPQQPCVGCGDSFEPLNARHLSCAACQAARDIPSLSEKGRRCHACKRTFWPIRKSHLYCYRCGDWRAGSPHFFAAACPSCGEHNRPAPGGMKTCIDCAQSSPEQRDSYLHALRRRVKGQGGPE